LQDRLKANNESEREDEQIFAFYFFIVFIIIYDILKIKKEQNFFE
jgi:hypothetical protein